MPSPKNRLRGLTGADLGPLDLAMVAPLLEAYVRRKGQPYRPLTDAACALLLRHSEGNPRLLATFGGLAVFLAILENTDRVEARHVETAASSGREVDLDDNLTPAGIADAGAMFALSSPGQATASRSRAYAFAAFATLACAAAYVPVATGIWRTPAPASQHILDDISTKPPKREASISAPAIVNVEIAPRTLASVKPPSGQPELMVQAATNRLQPEPHTAPEAATGESPKPVLTTVNVPERQTDNRSTPLAITAGGETMAQGHHGLPSPLLHVVLTFLPGDLAARDRGVQLTQRLRDIGYDATDPIPQTPNRRGGHVDYFFNTDAGAASDLATALGNKFGREALVSGRLEQRRPGTIEIALPSTKAVLSNNGADSQIVRPNSNL